MNRTTEPNTTWTKDQVVEESCHFQVVVLPVSAVTVICHHQQNGRTSMLIHMLSLGVPLACLVCCQRRHDVTRALANHLDGERIPARVQLRAAIVM